MRTPEFFYGYRIRLTYIAEHRFMLASQSVVTANYLGPGSLVPSTDASYASEPSQPLYGSQAPEGGLSFGRSWRFSTGVAIEQRCQHASDVRFRFDTDFQRPLCMAKRRRSQYSISTAQGGATCHAHGREG